MSSPYTLDTRAHAVLDALTDGLDVHASRKIDNANGAYMAVSVERIGASLFSVCHYFVQEGDLCQDPELLYLRCHGGWMPVMFQQALPPIYQEAVELGPDGATPVRYSDKLVRDLVSFSNSWMRNICDQQHGLAAIRAAHKEGK